MCTATCLQLHKRAERIASILFEKGHLNAGDNVVLLYPPGKDHRWCRRADRVSVRNQGGLWKDIVRANHIAKLS